MSRAASGGGREQDGSQGRQRHRQQHEWIVVSAAEMQQPGFGRGAEQTGAHNSRHGPARRQLEYFRSRSSFALANPFGAKSEKPRQQNGHRRAQRRMIKKVLPAKPAHLLAHIVDVESGSEQAGYGGEQVG